MSSNKILICVPCKLMHKEDLIREWGVRNNSFLNICGELESFSRFPSN